MLDLDARATSALLAAEAAGPSGFITGIDVAGKSLELAQLKAAPRGLRNGESALGELLGRKTARPRV